MKKFITVAGNIGVGKSSLVQRLSQRLRWQPFSNRNQTIPTSQIFMKICVLGAFIAQIFFLGHRLQVYRDLTDYPDSVILDRSLYEDAEIFAFNLYQNGYMSRRDYEAYDMLYQSLLTFLPSPDLVVYLRASVSTLEERIRQRDRDYERTIDANYLEQLNQTYETWISNFSLCPVLTVPADNLDFVSCSGHMDLILNKVQEKIAGKDEVIFLPEEYN